MLVELIDSIYVYQAEGTGKERTQKVEINYRFLCESNVVLHDGNGRIARLWYTTLLSKWKPIFEYIPLESQIEKFQDDYYSVIAKCHVLGESTLFIEFMLSQIDKILDDISKQVNEDIEQIDPNIKKLLDVMEDDVSYSSNELMQKLNLKAKEGFRRNYLRPAIDQNLIYMTIPDKPKSKNQRYIKV